MSKKIVLALGEDALGDDLVRQVGAVKITSQAVVDLIAQGHEVIVTYGNRLQVGVINQAFEAAAGTEAYSPMLPMSVRVALSQGYIDYDLQNALREELLSHGISRPVATLAIQVGADVDDPALLNPTKPIDSFFTRQEAELLTEQGYTLKEDTGCDYRRVIALPRPADIIEKGTVRALVDAGQVVITVGGGSIPVTREDNHLHGVSTVIDKGWASARLAEMIDADMLITLAAIGKVAVNFGEENGQWLDRLSLNDAECSVEEGHFVKDFMLPKVEAAASFARSRTGREALITILSKMKGGIEGKAGTMICQ